MRLITLTTDFQSGLYTGQVKGILSSRCPGVDIVEITNQVAAHSLLEAAFIVTQVCPCFPAGTVHLVVIDPTVGTTRRGLIAVGSRYAFVGPDNGILSWVLEGEASYALYVIDETLYPQAHPTFHARDVFAPVAASLATGVPPSALGTPTTQWHRLARPEHHILHIDGFGNIITSIEKTFPVGTQLTVAHGTRTVSAPFARTFADVRPGDYLVLPGSSGYLEVDRNQASAAAGLGAQIGRSILVYPASEPI